MGPLPYIGIEGRIFSLNLGWERCFVEGWVKVVKIKLWLSACLPHALLSNFKEIYATS